ncbi:MAG TPA: hypothetical protein VM364_07970 [Vicinamibacterales bacterium]|nr:hypothetical protein [Vicinamibacterales bacterium]
MTVERLEALRVFVEDRAVTVARLERERRAEAEMWRAGRHHSDGRELNAKVAESIAAQYAADVEAFQLLHQLVVQALVRESSS